MAEQVTIYKSGSNYYTVDGWADYIANGHSGTATATSATREKVSVSLIDSNAGKLYYNHNGSEAVQTFTRTDPDGVRRIRYTTDGATSLVEYWLYFVGGSVVRVYGAHPAAPGFSSWYTGPGGTVNFQNANAARYSFNGAFVHEVGNYEIRAAGLASGTAYDDEHIVYNNSTHQLWFGATVARGKSFVVYAGYHWFALLSTTDFTPSPSPNASTRTVSSGKSRALVADVDGYNSNTSSATVKKSDGSITFVYWRVIRQDFGDYERTNAARCITPATSTDGANGQTVVLRAVWTGAGNTGTRYAVGSIISEILTRRPSLSSYDTRVALYCEWAHRVSVTFDAQGGTQTTDSAYYSIEEATVFADEEMTSSLDRVSPPTKSDSVFLGYYSADGETAVTDTDGNILSSFAPTANATVYAHWRTVKDCALDKQGGTGGASLLTYDGDVGGVTVDRGSVAVESITPPRLAMFSFGGYYTAADGGTACIDSTGALLPYFVGLAASIPSAIYAHWTRRCWGLALDSAGGDGGADAIYSDGTAWYATDAVEEQIDAIEPPTRDGYTFHGYYAGDADDDAQLITADGEILADSITADSSAVARWTANTYTLNFDYNGGSGNETSREVTFGEPIGQLPTATREGSVFHGWMLRMQEINGETPYAIPGNGTALAQWGMNFGCITDWFGIGSQTLVPISSDSGDNRQRVCVSHTGRIDASETGGVWRNPSVTYQVVGNMTLQVTLGAAFAASYGISGYMITDVKISTAVGKYPTVTVSATANEGRDAINLFQVSIPILGRARAQNLLDVVTGGGHLQSCDLQATCSPVVVAEGNMPCASDVVGGRLVAQATTYAPDQENAPTAGGGFVSVGAPKKSDAKSYLAWQLKAERDL